MSYKDGLITSKIGKKTVSYPIPTVLDDIKEKQSEDNKALVSVHEAGHAILYALLFKTVPTQIVASTYDDEVGGFVGIHPLIGTKSQHLNDIIVSLGGRVAEELVFGKEMISSGASSDLSHSTTIASNIVRTWAMDESNFGYYTAPIVNKGSFKFRIEETDKKIEEILTVKYEETVKLVTKNMPFLLDVANQLMDKSSLTAAEFQEIAKKYMGEVIPIVNAGETLEVNYKNMLDQVNLQNKKGKK